MSSAGRGRERQEADFYATPEWCTEAILKELNFKGVSWCDPCAGDGAIIKAAKKVNPSVHWTAMELRPECEEDLIKIADTVVIGDSLAQWPQIRHDLILTNPPYSLAMEFIKASLGRADTVAMLLRLNFLGSQKRAAFFKDCMPDVYVLPKRPSFILGRTDSTEYGWFVFPPERNRSEGRVKVLNLK